MFCIVIAGLGFKTFASGLLFSYFFVQFLHRTGLFFLFHIYNLLFGILVGGVRIFLKFWRLRSSQRIGFLGFGFISVDAQHSLKFHATFGFVFSSNFLVFLFFLSIFCRGYFTSSSSYRFFLLPASDQSN